LFFPFFAHAYPVITEPGERFSHELLSNEELDKHVSFFQVKSEIGPNTPNRHYSPAKKSWYETGFSPCPYNDAPYEIDLFPVAQHLLRMEFNKTEACHYYSRFRWEDDHTLTIFVWLGRIAALQITYDLAANKVIEQSRFNVEMEQ
jgi:hypothetical protein